MTSNPMFRRRADAAVPGGAAMQSPARPLSGSFKSEGKAAEMLNAYLLAGIPVSVCIFAVDGLASFTESFGPEERRHMLSRLRALVLSNVRAQDVLGEIGGDRFVLLLPGTEAAGAVLVAERLLLACRVAAWNCAPVSLSLGVACAQPGCLAEERLQAAVGAAACALKAGGAQVHSAG